MVGNPLKKLQASFLGEEEFLFNIVLFAAIIGVVFYFFQYIETRLPVKSQALVGWGMVGVLTIVYSIKAFWRTPYRVVFIILSGLISFRYLVWRSFETLIYTGYIDMIGMVILYLAEVYALALHFMGMYVNVWPEESEPEPLPADPSGYPTVDVFIPTYNEPEDIVKVTATAASQIDYPKDKLRVHILDDGSTTSRRNNPQLSSSAWQRHFNLKRMAMELGINYISREANTHAKAGNINHALCHTDAELVLVLDCDHVPTKDILKKTIGGFLRDKKLFLVQTPHFFINPPPVERNLNTPDIPFESDMFFRVIHLGLNFWNSSYFCGSAAVVRRKFLMEVGGVAGDSITEDAETSLLLHSKGYNSAYINRPMVCGLSPETFDDYIIQRTRWAQGMLQIFILKNPLLAKGMRFSQRLCYFNSCFFWFFSFSRVVFYLAPALFLILGLKVYHTTLMQIVAYALPHLVSVYMTMSLFYGRVRQPFFSEIYESVQSIFLLPSVISVMLNPKKPVFKITPKGKKLATNYLNHMATSFSLVVVVNLIAMYQAVIKWLEYPLYRDVIILAAAWCLFNIVLSLLSLGAFWESKQIRRYHRIAAKGRAEVFFPGFNQTVQGEIKDISMTGMGVEIKPPFTLRQMDEAVLKVSDSYGKKYEFQARLFREIKRGQQSFCGFDFVVTNESYLDIVSYVYGDSQKWAEIWESRFAPRGTLLKLCYFLVMGLRACKESFIGLIQGIYGIFKKYTYDLIIEGISLVFRRFNKAEAAR